MDYQVVGIGPQKAFGMKRQEIEEGILKIRISLKSNLQQNISVTFIILTQRKSNHLN